MYWFHGFFLVQSLVKLSSLDRGKTKIQYHKKSIIEALSVTMISNEYNVKVWFKISVLISNLIFGVKPMSTTVQTL